MTKIVECVPNISEGKSPDIYNTIAQSCEKVSGVKLLDVDPGAATNRTVITFAGSPDVIVDAAFEVIKTAKDLIDMRTHHGEHARMGAVDVCPFVPVSGASLEECAALAKTLAKRVGEELGVWVYLYEKAASKPEWQNLATVRKGEYEGLKDRVGKIEWKPDFGPDTLDPMFGAMAIGARKFLIAYNINVNSKNVKMAKDIAFNIRESGRAKRKSYPDGEIYRHPDGTSIKIPGIFKHCKSTAWLIPEYECAQLTMNLTDIDVTPVHVVFDEVERQAHARGMRITGSEIVGLVPLQTMLEAGIYFAKKQGLSTALSEKEIINIAIRSLGLRDVAPFDPNDKIIEYRFRTKGELVSLTCEQFVERLASDAPAPGGGSVAALCGAMAAALGTMVTNLTHSKIEFAEHKSNMEHAGVTGQKLIAWFLAAVDRDTDAFNAVMDAMRLPKGSEYQQKVRDKAILEANKACTLVPLEVLESCLSVLPILTTASEKGNPNCASDAGVGAHCLMACAEGAALNVRINLANIEDQSFKAQCTTRIDKALKAVFKGCDEIIALVNSKIDLTQIMQ